MLVISFGSFWIFLLCFTVLGYPLGRSRRIIKAYLISGCLVWFVCDSIRTYRWLVAWGFDAHVDVLWVVLLFLVLTMITAFLVHYVIMIIWSR